MCVDDRLCLFFTSVLFFLQEHPIDDRGIFWSIDVDALHDALHLQSAPIQPGYLLYIHAPNVVYWHLVLLFI